MFASIPILVDLSFEPVGRSNRRWTIYLGGFAIGTIETRRWARRGWDWIDRPKTEKRNPLTRDVIKMITSIHRLRNHR